MAHDQQQQYLKKVIGVVPSDTPFKMCDLGSLDINGGVRALIPGNFQYIGVDLEIGPNVDIARPAQLLDLASEQFDFLISSELFEHTPYWKEIFAQMCRLTKPGGIVAFTCAGAGRAEHGTTRSDKGLASPFTVSRGEEYYGNVSRKDASKAVALKYWFSSYGFFEDYNSRDLYFVGLRKKDALSKPTKIFDDLLNTLKLDYPVKRFRVRYWTLKILPFPITDEWLKFSDNYFYSIRSYIYNLYFESRIRGRIRRDK